MISLLKSFFNFALICSLVFNPTVTLAETPQDIIQKIESFKTFKDHARSLTDSRSVFVKSYVNYLHSNGLLDRTIPQVTSESDGLSFRGYPDLRIVFHKESSEITLKFKKKEMTVREGVTFEELESKFLSLYQDQSFSFSSILINEAHAVMTGFEFVFSVVLMTVLIFSVRSLVDMADKVEKVDKESKEAYRLCKLYKEQDTLTPEQSVEVKRLIENIKIHVQDKCKETKGKLSLCISFKEIQLCLEGLPLNTAALNVSDRSSGKDQPDSGTSGTPAPKKVKGQ